MVNLAHSHKKMIEKKSNHIIHCVEECEGIKLSKKSRNDIYLTVKAVAMQWKKYLDEMREKNHAKRWNELSIWLRSNRDATVEDIEHIMHKLNYQEYIRGYKIKK